jgi:hypothetical protein
VRAKMLLFVLSVLVCYGQDANLVGLPQYGVKARRFPSTGDCSFLSLANCRAGGVPYTHGAELAKRKIRSESTVGRRHQDGGCADFGYPSS